MIKTLGGTAVFVAALATPALAQTQISYWLWDSSQQPAYQACADAFQKQNPKDPLLYHPF